MLIGARKQRRCRRCRSCRRRRHFVPGKKLHERRRHFVPGKKPHERRRHFVPGKKPHERRRHFVPDKKRQEPRWYFIKGQEDVPLIAAVLVVGTVLLIAAVLRWTPKLSEGRELSGFDEARENSDQRTFPILNIIRVCGPSQV